MPVRADVGCRLWIRHKHDAIMRTVVHTVQPAGIGIEMHFRHSEKYQTKELPLCFQEVLKEERSFMVQGFSQDIKTAEGCQAILTTRKWSEIVRTGYLSSCESLDADQVISDLHHFVLPQEEVRKAVTSAGLESVSSRGAAVGWWVTGLRYSVMRSEGLHIKIIFH